MNKFLDKLFRGHKKAKTRRLSDIEIDEISLVDKPANRQNFLITKMDEEADDLEIAEAPIDELRGALSEILTGAKPNTPELPAAATILGKYKGDFPDDVLAGIQSFAAAILEILDTPPAPTTENILDAAETVAKSGGDWPSLGSMTVPLLNLVNPKIGSRLLQKAAEERGPDPRDEEIKRLLSENERLRSSRSPSSQKRFSEFDEITKVEDDDVEDRWPSLHLFGY